MLKFLKREKSITDLLDKKVRLSTMQTKLQEKQQDLKGNSAHTPLPARIAALNVKANGRIRTVWEIFTGGQTASLVIYI